MRASRTFKSSESDVGIIRREYGRTLKGFHVDNAVELAKRLSDLRLRFTRRNRRRRPHLLELGIEDQVEVTDGATVDDANSWKADALAAGNG